MSNSHKLCTNCKYVEQRPKNPRCLHTNALIAPLETLDITVPSDHIYAEIHRKCDCGDNAQYWEPKYQLILDVTPPDRRGLLNIRFRKKA